MPSSPNSTHSPFTTIAVCIGAVNFLLSAGAGSGFFVENPSWPGNHELMATAPGAAFCAMSVCAFLIAALSALLIQSPEIEANRGARFLVSSVPAGTVLLLV